MDSFEKFKRIREEINLSDNNIVFVVKRQSFDKILGFLNKYFQENSNKRIILGENYVNEAKKLKEYLKENLDKEYLNNIEWHLIGPLQKSNINKALRIFDVIQTVDSYELAEEINKKIQLNNPERKVDVYLQINIGHEEKKSGVKPEYDLIRKECLKISGLKQVNLRGLMCIEPFFKENQKENSREYFRKMKEIFDRLNKEGIGLEVLSMGMSNTYKTAIEEGSNMVRVGRVVFGERE